MRSPVNYWIVGASTTGELGSSVLLLIHVKRLWEINKKGRQEAALESGGFGRYGVTLLMNVPQSALTVRGALGMYSFATHREPPGSATAAE